MPTTDDCRLLGLTLSTPRARKSTAVSQALQALKLDLEMPSPPWEVHAAQANESFQFRMAGTAALRARASVLVRHAYGQRGYLPDHEPGSAGETPGCQQPHALFTLLAQDRAGQDAATVSLAFDRPPEPLPCDAVYPEEVAGLRRQGRKVVEVTRLAIASPHQASKLLLLRLFNFIYIYARKVRAFDDFLIEVNPRHVAYYNRLLKFETCGPERPCPRVNGAPAVLLRLPLSVPEQAVRLATGQPEPAGERSLYPRFFPSPEEDAVAAYLKRGF